MTSSTVTKNQSDVSSSSNEEQISTLFTPKNIDFLKQGKDLLNKNKTFFKDKGTEIFNQDSEKNYLQKLKGLQSISTAKFDQLQKELKQLLPKDNALQTSEDLTHFFLQNHKLKTTKDIESTLNISNVAANNLLMLSNAIVLSAPKEVTDPLASLFGLYIDENVLKKATKPSAEAIQEQAPFLQEWLQINQTEKNQLIKTTTEVVNLLNLPEQDNPPTKEIKNGMQPANLDIEEAGRGNLTSTNRIINWIGRINRRIENVLNRFNGDHSFLYHVLIIFLAMLYCTFFYLAPFEAIRTYAAAQGTVRVMFYRQNGTNTPLLAPEFRPGEWDNEQGTLVPNQPGANTLAAFSLGIYGITSLAYFILNRGNANRFMRRSAIGIMTIYLIAACIMSSLLYSPPLRDGTNPNLLSGLVALGELFNIMLALIIRRFMMLFLSFSMPSPANYWELTQIVFIFNLFQIPTIRYMQGSLYVAAGVYGQNAARLRVLVNSAAEAILPIGAFLFASRGRFLPQIAPWVNDETPTAPNPGRRRVIRAANAFFTPYAGLSAVYACIFLIGIPLATTIFGLQNFPAIALFVVSIIQLGATAFLQIIIDDSTPPEGDRL
jgi:hypothetical protein